MYELSASQCERRLSQLREILSVAHQRDPDFGCACSEKARARRGKLLQRARSGNVSGLDDLLEYYRGCINSWARDICPTEAARSCFMAELAATLKIRVNELTESGFCTELHVAATKVAIAQHTHVLEWHKKQAETGNESEPAFGPHGHFLPMRNLRQA